MKLLKSKKGIPIPTLFFVTDKSEIKDIPKGVPYFLGSQNTEEYIITILEYEVLYQKAISTGYPFNFKEILHRNGFSGINDHGDKGVKTSLGLNINADIENNRLVDNKKPFVKLITDGNFYVDISIIKSLNVFPVWMDKLEDAISANIHNFATFDSNLYNKKLEGMFGGMVMNAPGKNLIIIDISSSIPQQVSSTCLVLAQNMSESFYADILITGSKSTLYEYENVHKLNIETIYDENGQDNDQIHFKALLNGSEKQYNTAIVFGDDDNPNWEWSNRFNYGTKYLKDEDEKKLNKWKVNKIISFHTYPSSKRDKRLAGYARWFDTDNIEYMPQWVRDLG